MVELPPLKKDHRYRIGVGGAAHVNSAPHLPRLFSLQEPGLEKANS
jgi:hypothetical protein